MRFALLTRHEEGHSLAPILAELALFNIEVVPIRATRRPDLGSEAELFAAVAVDMLDQLTLHGPWDGVVLALNGGEHPSGGPAGLAGRVRRILGPNIPVATLNDVRGNASRQLLDSLTVMWAVRTMAVDPAARRGRA